MIPVAIATALAERLYRASAMVQIDPEPMQVLPYREFDLPSLTPNYEMFMKSQEQILRGSALISRVAARLRSEAGPDAGLLKSEVANLGERLWLQRIENTQIFRLGYVAPHPAVAARVANIYAEEYLKLHFDTRQQTREKAKQQLEAELRALEENVRNSDRELVAYAQAHGISTAENARSLIQEKLATLSTQLTDAEAEVFAARSRLDSLGESLGRAVPREADDAGDFGPGLTAHGPGGREDRAPGDVRPELGRRGSEGQGDGAGPRAARAREVRGHRAGAAAGAP